MAQEIRTCAGSLLSFLAISSTTGSLTTLDRISKLTNHLAINSDYSPRQIVDIVTEWRVCHGKDVLFFQVREEPRLQQVRVCLDLVCSRRDLRGLQQLLRGCYGKVTYSDTSDLARLDKPFESSPGIGDRNVG